MTTQDREALIRQARCEHQNVLAPGNYRNVCQDCGLDWDFRTGSGSHVVRHRLADALAQAPAPADVLRNIHTTARMALSFGRGPTPQTPEKMIERRDARLRQIVRFCEDAGVPPPSLLRAALSSPGGPQS